MSVVINDRAQRRKAPARRAGASPGLRERNKERKLQRIERAGRALFAEKGFDGTTTRAIASKAGIAAGTFFLYFREKRDLLFHLFEYDVSAVQEEAFASRPAHGPLVAQMAHVFGRFYAYYARDPRLSRVFMKELLFLERGERDDMLALTLAFIGRVAELVAGAAARGEIEPSVDPMQVAMHAFALYLLGLIGWLNGAIESADDLQAQLEAQLHLLMRGLAPRRRP